MLARIAMFACLSTPVFADCPTRSDLTGGIRMISDDGSTDVYRAGQSGIVELLTDFGGGYVSRTLLGQGVYLIEIVDFVDDVIDPATRQVYSYPVKPEEMPVPVPGGQWSGKTGFKDQYGSYAEKQTHVWGALTSVTYGNCTYQMIPTEISYFTGDATYQEVNHYLPELGIGVLHSYVDGDASGSYTYTVIEAVNR